MPGRVDVDDAERAGGDAVAAAVAGVRLDQDRVELGPDDRPGRADLQAGAWTQCLQTSLIISQRPSRPVRVNCSTNLTCRQLTSSRRGVVVAVARSACSAPPSLAGELVPLVAGHLARLAADADVVSVKKPTARRSSALACAPRGVRRATPSPRCTRTPSPRGSTRSGRRRSAVRSLTTSPVTRAPCSPSATAGRRGGSTLPSMVNGRMRRVTSALARGPGRAAW